MKKINLKNGVCNINSIIKGSKNLSDIIAPSAISFKNPNYAMIDNTYISGLFVSNYVREQEIGWMSPLFNLDFDADISMFYEKLDSSSVIKELTYYIGNINTTIKVVNKNQQDIDIIETSYEDAKYIRREMQINKEELYRLYIYISIFGDDIKDVNFNIHKLEGLCASMGLQTRRAIFRQEQVLKAIMPIHMNDGDIAKSSARNVLTGGLISTYPFISTEICDKEGIVIGYNEYNRSMVIVDRFDSNIYKNANMCVLGTSGAGKSFLVKLMIIRNRFMNIDQFVIDPDREYERVCKILDGSMIKLGGISETYINIFDIHKNNIEDEAKGYLKDKIGRLNTFFSLIFTDMNKAEKVYLEEKLIECYKNKGITFDDSSLYIGRKEDNNICLKKNFKGAKDMPLIQDLYKLLDKNGNTKRLAIELKPFVYGSLSFFNNYTNINLNNKLIIADIHDLDEKILPIGMFLVTDMFWNKIKENRSRKKIIYMDEVWRLIGSSGNADAANFVYKIFKTIRKYGGGATAITQDVSDFFSLDDGKYGKAVINNSALKIILQLEEEDVKTLKDVINISEEEEIKIKSFERGVGLFFAGRNHTVVRVKAYDKEHDVITTDRRDLEKLNLNK